MRPTDGCFPVPASHLGRRRDVMEPMVFSSSRGVPRVRRSIDVAIAAIALLLLVPLSRLGRPPRSSELLLSDIANRSPEWLADLWIIGYAVALSLPAVALIAAVIRRRYAIVLESAAAAAIAALLLVLGTATAGYSFTASPGADPATTWPPAGITVAAALLLAITTEFAGPLRSLAHWFLGLGLVTSVMTTRTTVTGAVAALLVALAAAAIARLAVGTSAGRLSQADINELLEESGIAIGELGAISRRSDGVMLAAARGVDGVPLQVKVRGRDAIEGRRLARAWHALAYRDESAPLAAGRGGVEGEALATLLSAQRGALVWPVEMVARVRRGVEVLVLRAEGRRLAHDDAIDEPTARRMWAALASLHATGVAHLNIQAPSLALRDDGSVCFTDLSEALVGADETALSTDRAQLLVLQSAWLGVDAAVGVARASLDDDQIVATLPFLQKAALPRALRRSLDLADIEVDALRAAMAEAVAVSPPKVAPLRKLTVGAFVRTGLLIFAAATLIPMLLSIDWGELRVAVEHASLLALVGAFVVGQTPRPLQALSTVASVPARLPFVPVYVMQLATGYLNIALPNAAARMALTTRFFSRQGVPPATAVTSSLIDSFFGNGIQIVLLLVMLGAGVAALDTDVDLAAPDGPSLRLVALIAVIAVIAIATTLVIPALRRRVGALLREWWPQVKASAAPLHTPRKLGQMLGGTIGAELLFAGTLLLFVEAYGGDISLAEALLVNIGASLLATVVPVPGGIGVTESSMIVGLVGVGVDAETAFAAVISTRLATFYLPPVWGWFALRWLTRREYI